MAHQWQIGFKISSMRYIITLSSLLMVISDRILFEQPQILRITVSNVREERGHVLVALYSSPEDFMTSRFISLKLPAKGKEVTGSFDDVPGGVYAISVLHDLNSDEALNKNALGIPLEGIGFSNNATGRFGPPDFKKVAFEFPKTKELNIELKYW